MGTQAVLNNAYWIPLAPLAAFAVIMLFKKWVGHSIAWVGVIAMTYCLVHSLMIATGIFNGTLQLPSDGLQGHFFESAVNWFSVGDFDFQLGILIDGLSAVMLVVVTLVALLVQIYSISYMHDHIRFGRYFAYVNLFTFSMLVLVVANNMLQFFMGWELVGLCSYLLIGFDFEREAAAYAGRKAFLTTRVGDLGFYLALLTIFNFLGTFNIPALQQHLGSVQTAQWVLNIIPVLLFMGAMGKSAQVPLHVWLPDAMEGPTPASALIHAATMVAAGVYMVARVYFLFQASHIALDIVAWIGVTTAIVAATMGLVNSDIKRVLAFSTVSQLGFMMAGLGCGGYQAGLFHLTTHAAFKALLFLCAGSVIHAVHTNDMWKMGGLMTKMPITAVCYLIATLSISGLPLSSGFFSKEEILTAAYHHNIAIFALLAFAAFLTSFYMFRSFFLTFTGQPRDPERYHHAHESPALMSIPLIVLAVPSALLGGLLHYRDSISTFIHWGEEGAAAAPTHEAHMILFLTSLTVFLLGFAGAYLVYSSKPPKYDMLGAKFRPIHLLLNQRYKFDELYLWVIAHVYYPLAQGLAWFDYNVVDQGIVDGFGRVGKSFSKVSALFDFNVIDQIGVDGQADWIQGLGRGVRKLQTGLAQSYLFWVVVGLGGMLIWMAHNYK